jgi:uncharacterized protein (TIGR03067 family)
MLCFAFSLLLGLTDVLKPGAAQIDQLVAQLGDPVFRRRKQASLALAVVGEVALPAVRRAAATSADPEIRHRAGQLIPGLEAARAAADMKRLQGTWTVLSLTFNGEQVADGPWLANARVIFHGEQVTLKQLLPDEVGLLPDGSFALDVHQEPPAIDLIVAVESSHQRYTRYQLLGIYGFDNRTLKLCLFAETRPGRPTAFESRKGGKTLLMTLKPREP